LAEIAGTYPDLWTGVAVHPQSYPELLGWLAGRGDPGLTATVQGVMVARQAPPAPMPPPGYPAVYPTPGVYAGAPVGIHQGKSGVQKAFDSITGFEGEAIVRFLDLFRDTLKRHTRADMDALMYAGTQAARNDRQWRLPWLYSRVFLVLISTFILLWLAMIVFSDTSGNVIPGVIFTGALVMPATLMVFFWEFNQAKNVSLFDVLRIFFTGGAMSILLLFIVSAVTDLFQTDPTQGVFDAGVEALFIGFTEEFAKAVVVFILVRRFYGCLISNGLLVGAVVGTGFAVFETMGYGTTGWMNGDMEQTLLLRGILSVGGHVVWTAICGAAIMLAQAPGSTQARLGTMAWQKFIPLFCVPFLLHSLWDFSTFVATSDVAVYSMLAGLTIVAWVFIVRLINTGLRQYASLLSQNP